MCIQHRKILQITCVYIVDIWSRVYLQNDSMYYLEYYNNNIWHTVQDKHSILYYRNVVKYRKYKHYELISYISENSDDLLMVIVM